MPIDLHDGCYETATWQVDWERTYGSTVIPMEARLAAVFSLGLVTMPYATREDIVVSYGPHCIPLRIKA